MIHLSDYYYLPVCLWRLLNKGKARQEWELFVTNRIPASMLNPLYLLSIYYSQQSYHVGLIILFFKFAS